MATLAKTPRTTLISLESDSAGPFDMSFRIFDTDALKVYVNGEERENWTLSASLGGGYDDNATITFDDVLMAGDEIVIDSDLTPVREEDYMNGPNLVPSLNTELPRLWSAIADVKRDVSRAARGLTGAAPIKMAAGRLVQMNDTGTGFKAGPEVIGDDLVLKELLSRFDTISDMSDEGLLSVGDVVETAGYSWAGDGGGAIYEIVEAETGTDDGGSFINLSESGLQAKLLHNGTIACEQFGAVAGTEASAAVQAAHDALWNWQQAQSDPFTPTTLILRSAVTFANQVELKSVGGGTTDFMHIDFTGSSITGVSGGNLSDSNAILKVRATQAAHRFGYIDGGKAYAGLDLYGVTGARSFHPEVRHCKGFHIRVRGSAGGYAMYAPLATEYYQQDAEYGDQSNYSAIGLLVETGDWNCYNANFLFCKTPIKLTDGTQCHFVEGHFVNGNANWVAGAEPIVLLLAGQSNTGLNQHATSGDKSVSDGVYIWDGDFETTGSAYSQAAFGTAPLDKGSPPYVNNQAIHAANELKASTGRDVYIIWIAHGGRKIETFLKPETIAKNGWTLPATNYTPFMYPQIADACRAVPGRNSAFPDVVLWQQGEANDNDTAAEYQAKLEALVGDMRIEGVCHPDKTQFRAGGLVPDHAFHSDHAAAVAAAAANLENVEYVSTTGLADVGDDLHFTGEALVTLGGRYAASVSLPAHAEGHAPFCDSVLVENHSPKEVWFDNCYFDNGRVHDYRGNMCVQGGHYVNNGAATLTDPHWTIYPVTENQRELFVDIDAGSPSSRKDRNGYIRGLVGLTSIGLRETGSYSWADDVDLSDFWDEMKRRDNAVNVRGRDYNLFMVNDVDDPDLIEVNYKTAGSIKTLYRVGTDEIHIDVDPGAEIATDAPDFRVNSAASSRVLVGGGTVGIEEADGQGGALQILAGGGRKWEVQNDGDLIPKDADSYDIGSDSKRVASIFATEMDADTFGGAGVQASLTDATADRLMKTRAFGLGAAQPSSVADLNDAVRAGWYHFDQLASNRPFTFGGTVLVLPSTADRVVQIATEHSTGKLATRFVSELAPSSGSWTAWKIIATEAWVETSIAGTPSFVGQTAVAGGYAYIAIGTSSSADWKQATS